jgi:mono/diheme cytochrome c family protein
MNLRVIGLLAAASLVSIAGARAADVGRGKALAERWCAGCHVVSADQQRASADVPPFSTIAQRPDFSPHRLAFFLLDPHPKMPNLALSRNEAEDLAAYIASLGPGRLPPETPKDPPLPRRG